MLERGKCGASKRDLIVSYDDMMVSERYAGKRGDDPRVFRRSTFRLTNT